MKEFDRDNSGTIEFNEFAAAISVSILSKILEESKMLINFVGVNE